MKRKLVILYDFDGTLTPNSMPKYKILERCGYTEKQIIEEAAILHKDSNLDIYNCIFKTYAKILTENNLELTKENITLGVEEIELSKGVEEYFENLKEYNIDHYIISSGIKDYITHTKIAKYFKGIYGTTFNYKNNKIESIKNILTDTKKVDAIKSIMEEYKEIDAKYIYIGDGITDIYAMKFITEIGGKVYFVYDNDEELQTYIKLNSINVVTEKFKRDYSKDSLLFKEIIKEVENE